MICKLCGTHVHNYNPESDFLVDDGGFISCPPHWDLRVLHIAWPSEDELRALAAVLS